MEHSGFSLHIEGATTDKTLQQTIVSTTLQARKKLEQILNDQFNSININHVTLTIKACQADEVEAGHHKLVKEENQYFSRGQDYTRNYWI